MLANNASAGLGVSLLPFPETTLTVMMMANTRYDPIE